MNLKLFTSRYPFGFGESFLNNEIPSLKNEFEKISIYPFSKMGELQTVFDDSNEVVFETDKLNQKISLRDKMFVLKIVLSEILHVKQRFFILKNFKRFASILKNGVILSKWLELQRLDSRDVHYSFWMNEWALALAVMKKRGADINFVFRINGYDIYDDRHDGNYLPFRRFVYSQAKKIIPLSTTSRDHVKALNCYPDKVEHMYFGTLDHGEVLNLKSSSYTIFSCSNVIPLKRLDKIARVICLLDFPVKWVHHGEGESLDGLLQIMKSAPDTVEFVNSKRLESYFKVLELQKKLCPDLFINLSTTEGLPVTIMEAMSFGTPILCNDVGSCKEFITPFTGVLVSEEESEIEIAEHISKFKNLEKAKNDRNKIREYWLENFSAEKNYNKFAKYLKEQI